MKKWGCPSCGRAFARVRQMHSCQRATVEAHLEKASGDVAAIFRAVKEILDALGCELVPTKTSINVFANTSFAGIRVRRDALLLGFILARKLTHPRLAKVQQISPRTIEHHVTLRSVSDVDQQLRDWVTESHALGLAAGRR